MADVIATHAPLARVGLDKIIAAYRKKQTSYFRGLDPTLVPTTQQFYRMIEEGDFGLATQISENTGIPMDTFALVNQRDYYWVKQAIGYAASYEAMKSDQYGVIKKTAAKMARAFNATEELLAAQTYNNSFTTQLSIDGVSWINTAHPLDSGTSSNRGVLISGVQTDVALSYTGVAQAISEFMRVKSHRGIISPIPGPYTLVTGPAQGWIAETIITTNKRSGTTDNDDNVIQSDLVKRAVVNPYLTSETAWWLRAPADEFSPGLFRLNFAPMRTFDEYVKRLDRQEWYGTEIYAYHVGSWRGEWGTTG